MSQRRPNLGGRARHESGTDFLRAAAAASPHGLMVEYAGRVAYANAAYARLLGCGSPNEIVGHCVPVGFPIAESSTADNGNGQEWQTIRLEFRHDGKDMALHVVRDITEHRRLERRLRESEKMEALGRLVGGVAHDFNNILTAITLYSDLLRDRCRNPQYAEVDEIRQAAQRGGDIVRQLLTFARQQPVSPRVVSLSRVISGMGAVLEPLIGEDVELNTEFTATTDCVRADPSQLQQLVLNLVVNAREAMANGGRIKIETAACQVTSHTTKQHGVKPGPYVSLTISDTGCGMDESVRDRVFEPFFTTKQAGGGTGLGMAMVYGIATQSGGSVSVHSKPGKGTRVTVLLPQAPRRECEREPIGAEPEVCAGVETVLLVEDDDAVRASMARLLSASGYSVVEARDRVEAVRLARSRKHAIQLLLTDVIMPRMNGADAARQILRSHPEAKVLFVSGYPAKARAAAADYPLLYKPFSRAVLAQKIRETLDRRSPCEGGREPAARGTS